MVATFWSVGHAPGIVAPVGHAPATVGRVGHASGTVGRVGHAPGTVGREGHAQGIGTVSIPVRPLVARSGKRIATRRNA